MRDKRIEQARRLLDKSTGIHVLITHLISVLVPEELITRAVWERYNKDNIDMYLGQPKIRRYGVKRYVMEAMDRHRQELDEIAN